MIDWVFGLARMLGLGAAAGTRPWLTLALFGLLWDLGEGAPLEGVFVWLGDRRVLLVLGVLAILEAGFDKIARGDLVQDRIAFPLRLTAGAVAGAATVDAGWPGLVIGLAVGGFAAWLAQHVKHVRRPRATRSEATIPLLSLIEDLYVFVGTVGTLAWSPVGLAVFAWPGALWVEARRRRKAKYAALRRPRDPGAPDIAASGGTSTSGERTHDGPPGPDPGRHDAGAGPPPAAHPAWPPHPAAPYGVDPADGCAPGARRDGPA